jgi:hypothetical protein
MTGEAEADAKQLCTAAPKPDTNGESRRQAIMHGSAEAGHQWRDRLNEATAAVGSMPAKRIERIPHTCEARLSPKCTA